MFNHLLSIITEIKGNVLTIGIDDKLLKGFKNNDCVNVYTLNKYNNSFSKSKKRISNKGKTINIKRLKKYFKKNSLDYIICDYNDVKDYLKYVVRDIVYTNSNTLYLYCTSLDDADLITKRFRRYGAVVDIKKFKQNYLLTIDNSNSKTNWILNKIFYMSDTAYNIVELISAILTS